MNSGTAPREAIRFNDWLGGQPHRHKVVIAGNHDRLFEDYPLPARARLTNAIYLEDSGVEVAGLKFWGSPVQPPFMDWAFNVPRGAAIRRHWDRIPAGTDVLMTHGPPYGILDLCRPRGNREGCEELAEVVGKLAPRLHVFGHIHEGYGRVLGVNGCEFVNASVLDERYRLVNAPWMVDLEA